MSQRTQRLQTRVRRIGCTSDCQFAEEHDKHGHEIHGGYSQDVAEDEAERLERRTAETLAVDGDHDVGLAIDVFDDSFETSKTAVCTIERESLI